MPTTGERTFLTALQKTLLSLLLIIIHLGGSGKRGIIWLLPKCIHVLCEAQSPGIQLRTLLALSSFLVPSVTFQENENLLSEVSEYL